MRLPGLAVAEPRLPLPVVGSRTLAGPLTVMVALDESGSTASSDPNRQSHRAVLEICDWLASYSGEERDRVGVVRFADTATAIPPIRAKTAKAEIEQQLLAGASVGGGTQLTPAIEELRAQLGSRRERRVAVLVTDGQVAESGDRLHELFVKLNRCSDAVYMVALDHDKAWSRSTYRRYSNLGIAGTTAIGTLGRAHLAHAIAEILMRETGLVARRRWRP
jgi:Mg-chelatase subunit ChlD